MIDRNQRIVDSFINMVNSGEFSYDYAKILIEDGTKYPFLTEANKAVFYNAFIDHEKSPTYEMLVRMKIKEKYSDDDEFQIQRKRDTEPEKFAAYNTYCEECIATVRRDYPQEYQDYLNKQNAININK